MCLFLNRIHTEACILFGRSVSHSEEISAGGDSGAILTVGASPKYLIIAYSPGAGRAVASLKAGRTQTTPL